PFMRVLNADGSEPEMCGNGLRCVALHLARTGRARADAFVVDTGAGPHAVRFVRRGDRLAVIEVAMNVPPLVPPRDPIRAGETTLHVTGVAMGNPHLVTFDPFDRAQRERLGPVLGGVDAGGANIGFAVMESETSLHLDVYERGAGW